MNVEENPNCPKMSKNESRGTNQLVPTCEQDELDECEQLIESGLMNLSLDKIYDNYIRSEVLLYSVSSSGNNVLSRELYTDSIDDGRIGLGGSLPEYSSKEKSSHFDTSAGISSGGSLPEYSPREMSIHAQSDQLGTECITSILEDADPLELIDEFTMVHPCRQVICDGHEDENCSGNVGGGTTSATEHLCTAGPCALYESFMSSRHETIFDMGKKSLEIDNYLFGLYDFDYGRTWESALGARDQSTRPMGCLPQQLGTVLEARGSTRPRGLLMGSALGAQEGTRPRRGAIPMGCNENCHTVENAGNQESVYCNRHSNIYQTLLECGELPMEKEPPIWSIFTDRLSYVTNGNNEKQKLYYQVYNGHQFKKWKRKSAQCKIPHINSLSEIDERYLGIQCDLKDEYDPHTDISATYLWPMENVEKKYKHDSTSWFAKPIIPVNARIMNVGGLIDGTPCRTLWDSGATKSMMNKTFYKQHPILHKYPIFKIKAQKIRVANDQVMIVREAIKFVIQFSGHLLEIISYLLPFANDIDLIMGAKTMMELESTIDFQQAEVVLTQRSLEMYPNKDIHIPPKTTSVFYAGCTDLPPEMNSCKVIVKLKLNREDMLPQTVETYIERGRVYLHLHNYSKTKPLEINKDEVLGCLDFRSAGYFHLTRESIQRILWDKFIFYDDDAKVSLEGDTTHAASIHADPEIQDKNQKNSKLLRHSTSIIKQEEHDMHKSRKRSKDPYPWLDKDDPRRDKTDKELIKSLIDLNEAKLSTKEKREFRRLLLQYREAFSLRDEIGMCPNMEVKLELTDTTPFYIRPFPIKDEEKMIVDKEMRKGVLLGILRKGLSSYSSPIMLIPRKLGGVPRIITDFRHLNSRLVRLNCAFPLVRDAIQMLGSSKCEVMSVIDLRDAYHTLRLHLDSQKYCGITPYFGSDTYIYQRLGMGLSVSPAIWQTFINKVLDGIVSRKHHLAIMDDCLVHSKKKSHMRHLENLFKALVDNGLKISPKKCQFFRTSLTYMGQNMLIKDDTPCITPLRTRVDAIQRVPAPTNIKGCRSFCGMVNYLSMYLQDLQRRLIPIYNLTKKGIPYVWTDECEHSFESIKKDLQNPPILVMPNNKDLFTLVSDTSIEACGAALYQTQKNILKLVGYNSKRLPGAAARYSISELELTGLAVNIHSFKHLLRNTFFTVIIDHSALVYIIKSKKELPTLRLAKLIEVLLAYAFKVQFLKGKDMFVSDFLSRYPGEDLSPTDEIIPISFHIRDILDLKARQCTTPTPVQAVMQNLERMKADKAISRLRTIFEKSYPAGDESPPKRMTRSRVKERGEPIKEIWPLRGTHVKPEHEKRREEVAPPVPLPEPIHHDPDPIMEQPQVFEQDPIQELLRDEPAPRVQLPVNLPHVPAPVPNVIPQMVAPPVQPPPQDYRGLIRQQMGIAPIPVVAPYKEPVPLNIHITGGIPQGKEPEAEITIRPPEPEMYNVPKPLFDIEITDEQILRKHIPKQVELEKYLQKLKKKIIQDFHIPLTIKEMSTEYEQSPYFKVIYKYIKNNVLPSELKGVERKKIKAYCEDFLIADGVLFKLKYSQHKRGEPTLLLCIPEKLIPRIMYQYHNTLLAGHQGVQRTYHTLKQKFYWFNMFQIIRQYIACCQDCQVTMPKVQGKRKHFIRYPLNYRPMSRISADVKYMPPSTMGMKFILYVTCEVTGYIIGIPLRDTKAITLAEAFLNRVVYTFGPPDYLMIDADRALSAAVMIHIYATLMIQPKIISPGNHGSLKTERSIGTISRMLTKFLTGTGRNWPLYVNACCYAHNTFVSSILKYSPFELVYLRKPAALSSFEHDPVENIPSTTEAKQYVQFLLQKFEIMKKCVVERTLHDQLESQIAEARIHSEQTTFRVGDLVYMKAPGHVALQAPSRSIKHDYIGPLVIAAVLDNTHFMLKDLEGKIIPWLSGAVFIEDLKPCELNLGRIVNNKLVTAKTLEQYLQAAKQFEPP